MCWIRLVFLLAAVLGASSQTICPTNWTLYKANCYKLFNNKVYYSQALSNCNNVSPYPSSLVSITSSEEQTFVKTMLIAGQYQYVWLGLNDRSTEGTFQWTDGSSVSYTNWAKNQPDNLHDSDCVFMLPDGTWDDGRCEYQIFSTTPAKVYICKTQAFSATGK